MKIRPAYFRAQSAFTMVEIAISLAVVGIALLAILKVLPLGMETQRENREQTLINQDATILMEDIRNGAHGADDLTNYVFAITNTYTGWSTNYFSSGAQIVGLLSTPEFVDINGQPTDAADAASSNHMVAFVHSMSGLAVEKPPQNNSLMIGSSFSYGVGCENVQLYTPPGWTAQVYFPQAKVSYPINNIMTYWQWQASTNSLVTDVPGQSAFWIRDRFDEEMAANSHEVRLTFLWPLLPDSQPPGFPHYGTGHWTYRASVAGQIVTNIIGGQILYFFQPQSFATNAP